MILGTGIILTLTWVSNAHGDPPRGTRAQINGETMECFTLEQYKNILRQDVSLAQADAANDLLGRKIVQQNFIIDNMKQIRESQERTISLLEANNDRLFAMWNAENKRRHEAESKPGSAPPYIAWVTAGVLALSTAVLGGMALSN